MSEKKKKAECKRCFYNCYDNGCMDAYTKKYCEYFSEETRRRTVYGYCGTPYDRESEYMPSDLMC